MDPRLAAAAALAFLTILAMPLASQAVAPGEPDFVFFSPPDPDPACAKSYMNHVGWVCKIDPLFEIYTLWDSPSSTANLLGHVHGVDSLPSFANETVCTRHPLLTGDSSCPLGQPTPFVGPNQWSTLPELPEPRMPHCVAPSPGEYVTRVYYARAINDGLAHRLPDEAVRAYVMQANALVDRSAFEQSADPSSPTHADLRFECEDGRIMVNRVTLATPLALTDFTSILQDIANLPGGNDNRVKHLVLFDAPLCDRCDATATFYPDDRRWVGNYNNGDRLPLYAVAYRNGTSVETMRNMLHALTHTMGAPAYFANHASGDGNCRYGGDVMCAPGNGVWGSYIPQQCEQSLSFDCPHNIYFDIDGMDIPDIWNLGDPMQRYIAIDGTSLDLLQCTPLVAFGTPTVCSYAGGTADATRGIRYEIDWGDGTLQNDPVTGHYTGPKASAWDHIYTAAGTYEVRVQAFDDLGRESGVLPYRVQIL